ncbi:aspartyl-tRNA synthetase AspS [Peptoclostridium acidaminophilum DSM 3953]|uniref:Aspartate--tRNA ligase n=1 Tax=Peptoclostridium acidaminophilum DSM 3953 TaxID=1286171 RepID=W8T5Z1_PEPAC|nr:aspartate--tRNA ligase [Peptoclostridium acidaminophilum]AHM56280.1 aspartyl-tRNA synthetase AspS [Peptoclostridium acidaminophilum DSM 3953]
MDTLGGLKRTHYCGSLREANIGEDVVLMGWVQRKRNLGGLIFVDLRDRDGITQIVFDTDISPEAFNKAEKLGSEYVIAVMGKVYERESKNPNMPTGDIEVFAQEIRVLNSAQTPPIYIKDDDDVSEALRLKYRYLDLRKPSMQRNFILRHKVAGIVRNYLSENGFLEIETPVLGKPTPEGARDYLVPSRVNTGKFYALPQSPQLFKQLLMVAGMDRYFQIVKCFRDEDLRADRQPEFTQIDCEMSFVEAEDIMGIMEAMMQKIFKEALGVDIGIPFRRITHKEAMERYGSDKPDLRFGYELTDISDAVKDCGFKVFADAVKGGGSVRGLNISGRAEDFTRKGITKLEDYVKTYGAKGLAWIKWGAEGINSPVAKFLSEDEMKSVLQAMNAKEGDILFFVADKNSVVYNSLGQLRCEIAKNLGLLSKEVYEFAWVTEFPLFEYDEEAGRLVAVHHPFTSPMDEDFDKIETDPGSMRAKAYDMVLNGFELGGGSIRIFQEELQKKMFKLLGFTEEDAQDKFGFFIDAFKYGTPPHGGIAFGLDRIIMLLAGEDNIRQVIAFPKTQNASCPLTEAPSYAEDAQLEELGIKIEIKE